MIQSEVIQGEEVSVGLTPKPTLTRRIPPSVQAAKREAKREAELAIKGGPGELMLSALGKMGSATKRVKSLRRQRITSPGVVLASGRVPYTEDQLRGLRMSLIQREEHLRIRLKDAETRALDTRPGWDDDYEVVSSRVDVGAATSDVVWFGPTTLWTKAEIAASKKRRK